MEDAMIVNKSAVERGFAHSTLYKTDVIQLRSNERFQRNNSQTYRALSPLDEDGLPHVGQRLVPESNICETFDDVSNQHRDVKLKGADETCVDKIKRICREPKSSVYGDEISITLRYNRNPIIGDKFSSRHGQKGVLSFLWPDEGLPFIERSGVRPDVLINPHAFPSRMTIGMLVESLASKSGALTGNFINASAFNVAKVSPIDTHGQTLRNLGYNYTGTETMINGVTGEPFEVDIYIGLVYYQRLRHMVSDKFQVRSTGPVNALTKQPIKGRKAGGGVRFGEMERDSLLAHGAAYLLRDRLHLSSDTHFSNVCVSCGSLISPVSRAPTDSLKVASSNVRCQVCETSSSIEVVALPYVFTYLAAELAAMNIQIKLSII
jgi:DNA-directed RNA polymerase I subunit RPA2